ncbi:hypothetical protein [Intestinibacter sp.]|uniref:hypothetical protein n=1 Tax=Intestinibacter sp. TaxID=1965304 RepID=UPI002A762C5B|nr:hypothetical protein [Intestinibacter sp.]MDY2735532.1 hypothetical protein [Intestinibacter sp.]MDY4575305.1 hypothetical protein [Intestinibacter sp.]
MYINFKEINPTLLNIFIQKFNLKPQDTTLLYKLTNTTEKKYDDFERSISPYLFVDNTYYISCDDCIYKITSKLESSSKISTENLISSVKTKISKDDVFKMYDNLNSLFTIFKNDIPQSQIKIINLQDTPKQKTLKYAYINGSLLI